MPFLRLRPTRDPHALDQQTRDRRVYSLAVVCLLALGRVAAADTSLTRDTPITASITGGETHGYALTLAAETYVQIEADQGQIDLELVLLDPTGKTLAAMDGPNGARREMVEAITPVAGAYRVEVRAGGKGDALRSYGLHLRAQRPASDADRARVGDLHAAHASVLKALGQLRRGSDPEAITVGVARMEEAVAVWRQHGYADWLGFTLNSIGYSQHRRLHQPRAGLPFYDQALAAWQQASNGRGALDTLVNKAKAQVELAALEAAVETFTQALARSRALGDGGLEADVHNDLGSVYADLWETQQALHHYRAALHLNRDLGRSRQLAAQRNNLAGFYRQLGEFDEAEALYSEALALSREADDATRQASALTNLGNLEADRGNHVAALAYFDRALPLMGGQRGAGTLLNSIGRLHLLNGEPGRALAELERGLALVRAAGDRVEETAALQLMGIAHRQQGSWTAAEKALHGALTGGRESGLAGREASVLLELARLERARGALEGAQARYETALALVESLRTKVDIQALRATFLARRRPEYEEYIDLLMTRHEGGACADCAAIAFQAGERARARSLLELLAEAQAAVRLDADPALLGEERQLRRRLSALGRTTPATADGRALQEALNAYREVEARIRAASPRYRALVQPRILGIEDLQTEVLDADSLLLVYALGARRSFLWAVGRDSFTSHVLPPAAELEAMARQVYEHLAVPGEGAAYWRRAAALTKALLGPVAGRLGDRRLLVVAEGALQYIPFAALPDPAMSPGGALQPLIVDHEVISLPSASTAALLRARPVAKPDAAGLTLAVLADPVFRPEDARVVRARRRAATAEAETAAVRGGGPQRFGRLRFSAREAQAIAALVPPSERLLALDFEASKALATGDALRQARIVHFATHGILDSERPELSALVLSLVDAAGQPVDGFLRLHDIYRLELDADLVVLSACQTALGREVRSEGLIGLTRGFLYAGARRVVASLWSVQDRATRTLMDRFYRGVLEEGRDPAAALRGAQVALWQQTGWEPYHWAGFVIQGAWAGLGGAGERETNP